jgi:hypothetical protein
MMVQTALSPSLYWEHDGALTPGFVVEESTNLPHFYPIGFVPVTQIYSTNATNFTYRFPLTNNYPQAFYRVGATF